MSLIQEGKTEIELEIGKEINGLSIKIQSDELNEYIEKWLGLWDEEIINKDSDNIFESLNFNDESKLIKNDVINLVFLVNNANQEILIDNVFTDTEIKKYVDLIQIYITQIIKDVQLEYPKIQTVSERTWNRG
tara:strand:- start:732 stop:1130 length:399 start_codon:yes stop_codon:yes gene_type:complete